MCSCFWKARSCHCKVFWLPVCELGGFPPFWFWLCCLRMSWFSSLLGLWFSLPLHCRSGFDIPLSIRSFREICSSSGSEKESVFYAVWVYCIWKCCWPPAFWSVCQVPCTVICIVPRLIRCWCIRLPPAVLKFLLPRILFIVCWWARFDTLASWVDWYPLHTRPLFVMCLVAFAIVFCLAPLHSSHWGAATHLKYKKKKKTRKCVYLQGRQVVHKFLDN